MKQVSLFWKLLALFLGVSLSLFVILNTIGLNLMQEEVLARTKEELYQDGTIYVSNYAIYFSYFISGCKLLFCCIVDVGQIASQSIVVETIADDKTVGNGERAVFNVDGYFKACRF